MLNYDPDLSALVIDWIDGETQALLDRLVESLRKGLDVPIEITPDGKIVWEWTAGDHLGEFGFGRSDLVPLHRALLRGLARL